MVNDTRGCEARRSPEYEEGTVYITTEYEAEAQAARRVIQRCVLVTPESDYIMRRDGWVHLAVPEAGGYRVWFEEYVLPDDALFSELLAASCADMAAQMDRAILGDAKEG